MPLKKTLERLTPWGWILASLLLFFPDVFLGKSGVLSGDHRLQHYPWFWHLWQAVRHFSLPWWTDWNQCGFPLLAEGQIGAFYPPNLLLCLLLPVRWAYNYSVLLHYFLGGLFFFLYARKIGLGKAAAWWATVIFLFGSSQGGLFYNVTSQRVLIWFPLALLLAHRVIERSRLSDALSLGAVFALASLGGYQQYAVYAIGFSSLYFLLIGLPHIGAGRGKIRSLALLAIALIFSFLLALPQWIPFFELSFFSSRAGLTEEFAYIGSMNPFGPLALFFPSFQGILGTELYVSVIGLFFVFCALFPRRGRVMWVHLLLVAISLLLAWGEFSPLYVGAVKLTHIYGFRIPVKFLFFAGFSLAVLSGLGFQNCRDGGTDGGACFRRAAGVFAVLLSLLAAVFLAASYIVRAWRQGLMHVLSDWIRNHVVGKPYRPHSYETYVAKLESWYETLLFNVNPANAWVMGTFLFYVVALVALWIAAKGWHRFPKTVAALLFLVLYADLFVYSFKNIRGDFENFDFVHQPSVITEILKRETRPSRIYIFNPEVPRESILLASNANILNGVANVGLYSPFAFREYKKHLGRLGAVDDSISVDRPRREDVYGNMELLRFLNVGYVLATEELEHADLRERAREGRVILYELERPWSRYLFVNATSGGFVDAGSWVREEAPARDGYRREDRKAFTIELKEAGYLDLSELNYPGWEARVDGRRQDIFSFRRLFKSIELSEGLHKVEFVFEPRYRKTTYAVSLSCLLLLAMSHIPGKGTRRHAEA
jgi:hypothetical protein